MEWFGQYTSNTEGEETDRNILKVLMREKEKGGKGGESKRETEEDRQIDPGFKCVLT